MQTFRLLASIFLAFFIAACAAQVTATQIPPSPSKPPTNTSQAVIMQATTETPVLPQGISCDDWQSWPVIPTVSETAREVYQHGQTSGNNPRAFSKIGDGEISTEWFFTSLDLGQEYYDLGPYQNLQSVIEYFSGSFGRIGMAARRGFNTNHILDSTMSDSTVCKSGESPLTCELRLHRPAFALLSLGTNQVWEPEVFEQGMRQLLDILLSENVIPILSTKGDNLEGDHRINRKIVCLAQEYDVPLWNFWSAIQSIPHHGLQPDLEHLTYGINDFDDPQAMRTAWTIRNLTALQMLDAVWKGATTQP